MRGGRRAPPTLTSQDWFYPHHWMSARKQPLQLCVLCGDKSTQVRSTGYLLLLPPSHCPTSHVLYAHFLPLILWDHPWEPKYVKNRRFTVEKFDNRRPRIAVECAIVRQKFRGVKIDDLKTTVNLFKHRDRGRDRNFRFLKKDDLLLLPIEGRVFNRRRAFDPFTCVDAHLCAYLCFHYAHSWALLLRQVMVTSLMLQR